jgi:hypothetical protein
MTDPTERFPGDATPAEIRTAIEVLQLLASHDGPDDWTRTATLARWIADAAAYQAAEAIPGASKGA